MAKVSKQQRLWEGFTEKYEQLYGPLFKASFNESSYEAHKIFALHAVFPAVFTADLLYQIWFNFRVFQGKDSKRLINLPNFVVSDFLLSGLCRSVGHRVYAIEHELRQSLLNELEQDSRFGRKRMESLATLLNYYHIENFSGSKAGDFSTYHGWLAEVVLDPEQAAARLASELNLAIEKQNNTEIQRLVVLLRRFADSDSSFAELAVIAEAITAAPGDVVESRTPVLRSQKPEGASWKISGPLPAQLLPLVINDNTEESSASEKKEEMRFSPTPFVRGKNTLFVLLIGFGEYLFPDQVSQRWRGCENDINDWEEFLLNSADSVDIKKLVNEAATVQAVIFALKELTSQMVEGDGLLVFFSGQSATSNNILTYNKEFVREKESEWRSGHFSKPSQRDTLLLFFNAQKGSNDYKGCLSLQQLRLLVCSYGKKKINITLLLDSSCSTIISDSVFDIHKEMNQKLAEEVGISNDEILSYPHTILAPQDRIELGAGGKFWGVFSRVLLGILKEYNELTFSEVLLKAQKPKKAQEVYLKKPVDYPLLLRFSDGAKDAEFLFGALKTTTRLPIQLIGSDIQLNPIRELLKKEPYLLELEEVENANYQIVCENSDLCFKREPVPIITPKLDINSETEIALGLARHMARWERIKRINLDDIRLPENLVHLFFEKYDPERDEFIEYMTNGEALELAYTKNSIGGYDKPKVRIKSRLNENYEWPGDVYVYLLFLDPAEGMVHELLGDATRGPAKKENYYSINGTNEFTFSLPDMWITDKKDRVSDYFKLFVSSQPFNVSELVQPYSLGSLVHAGGVLKSGRSSNVSAQEDTLDFLIENHNVRTKTITIEIYHPEIAVLTNEKYSPDPSPKIASIIKKRFVVLLLGALLGRDESELSRVFEILQQRESNLVAHYQSRITSSFLDNEIFRQFEEPVSVIHFSGLVEGERLMLEDGSIEIQEIAQAIRLWEHKPMLLFLNTSSGYSNVKMLLDVGIDYVIANPEPVNKLLASRFSVKFYKELFRQGEDINIKQAFDIAELYISSTHDVSSGRVSTYFDLYYDKTFV